MQSYNITVREFPSNLTAKVFGFDVKPNLTVEDEKAVSTAPKVDFGKPVPAPSVPAPAPSPAPVAPAEPAKKGG